MCGRTACALDQGSLCKRCTLNPKHSDEILVPKWNNVHGCSNYKGSYNMAPGSCTPVLTLGGKVGRDDSPVIISPMQWGLVPSFVRDESPFGYATSNARIESLLQKPAYRDSMKLGQRCVVLAEGFYEWKTIDGRKQPYYIFPSG